MEITVGLGSGTLSKQPWDVGPGTFLVCPQGFDSQLLYSFASVGFWGYLLLRCLLSLVWMVLTQPLWLASLGGWIPNNLALGFPLTLPIPPSHSVFVPGMNKEFDICPGPCPSFLKLFSSSFRDKGELTLCESVLPLGLVFFFSLRSRIKIGCHMSTSSTLHLYLSHFCHISASKSLIILLSAQNTPLAFSNWLTPSHFPALLGFSSCTTSPRKSSVIHPYLHPSTSSWEWEPPLCFPNAQSRALWSQFTAQNSTSSFMLTCISSSYYQRLVKYWALNLSLSSN